MQYFVNKALDVANVVTKQTDRSFTSYSLEECEELGVA